MADKFSKYWLLIILIGAELIIIIFLLLNLNYKKSILGISTASPIKKEALLFYPDSDLPDFNEPKPNQILKDDIKELPYNGMHYINSDSLNEMKEYSNEKPSGVYRIIALGDSWTYGMWVNTNDSYPKVLENLLNQQMSCPKFKSFEVINLGDPGYDIEYSVRRYKIRGEKYKPDLVLWFLKDDDFAEIAKITRPKSEKYKKEMTARSKTRIDPEEGFPWSTKANKEFKEEFSEKDILKYQQNALHSISTYFQGPLLIFTNPFVKDPYKELMRNFAKSRANTFFYDDIPDVQELKERILDKYSLHDFHPTKEGYSLIAGDLFKFLENSWLIPCN